MSPTAPDPSAAPRPGPVRAAFASSVALFFRLFPALRRRDYATVWSGSLLSNTGTWVQAVGKAWLVYELSPEGQKAFWLGVDAFASAAPTTILLPFGGVIADRFDRRRILVLGNALCAALALLLAILYAVGHLTVPLIIAVSILNGIFFAAMFPAVQSLLPQLVQPAELPNAVALNAIQFNLSRAIGPAIGGAILAELGAGWSFALNALSFLAIIFAISRLPSPAAPTVTRAASILGSFIEGLRYLRSRADLMVINVLVFTGGFCVAPAITMVRAYDDVSFGHSDDPAVTARRFALLLSGFGLGAVVGAALLAARSSRGPTPWRAFPLFMIVGALLILLGLPQYFATAFILFTFVGGCYIAGMNRMFAAQLASSPPSIRGRLASFHVLSFSLGLPLGSLLAGALATPIGIRAVFILFGAALILCPAALYRVVQTRRIRYAGALAAVDPAPATTPAPAEGAST